MYLFIVRGDIVILDNINFDCIKEGVKKRKKRAQKMDRILEFDSKMQRNGGKKKRNDQEKVKVEKQSIKEEWISTLSRLATLGEGDSKVPFSIAVTPRYSRGCYYFLWIAPLYPWSVPYNAEC